MQATMSRWLLAGMVLLSVAACAEGAAPPVRGHPLVLVREIRVSGRLTSFSFSRDGTLLATATSPKGKLTLWDLKTWKKLRETDSPYGARVVFAADDRTLVHTAASDDVFTVLSVASLKKHTSIEFEFANWRVCCSGGAVFALGKTQTIYFHDATTGKRLGEIKLPKGTAIDRMEMTRDNRFLALAMDIGKDESPHEIRILDRENGKETRRLRMEEGDNPADYAFSPDGRLLAAGSRVANQVLLWDVVSGRTLRDLRWESKTPPPNLERDDRLGRPKKGVSSLAFSPDGKTLAVCSDDGMLRLWELASGGVRLTADFGDIPPEVHFTADGKLLVTRRTEPGAVGFWDWRDAGENRPARLTPRGLERLWAECASRDARTAHRALAALRSDQDAAIGWIAKHLAAIEPADAAEVKRLLTDLDDDEQATRDRATARLAQLGRAVEADLRKAAENPPSAEVRRRLKGLLQRLETVTDEQLRWLRSVEFLELVASEQARRVLKRLSGGAKGALETEDARAALARLAAMK